MRTETRIAAIIGACWLTAAQDAGAQETKAEGGSSAGLSIGADTSGETTNTSTSQTTATATAPPAEGSAYGAAPESPTGPEPYMKRFRPEPGLWEVGVGATALFPSPALQLIHGNGPYTSYRPVALGPAARLAYFPLTWLGVEAEFMVAQGKVAGGDALFDGYRGHLILQLPVASIVPFLLGGVSGLGASSEALGRDIDLAGHAGVGFKIPFSQVFSLRAEFRENMTKRTDGRYAGISFSEEAMLGAVFTWGRSDKTPPPPPPPADRDQDTVPDERDQCPDTPALTSDGCPLDTDGDGVRDPDDFCPREPAPTQNGCPDPDPDQDRVQLPCDLCPEEAGVVPDGCPIRDQDGDGLLDNVDQCPDKPETQNGFEDDDGCPDEVPKEVEKFTGTIEGITFLKGSAQIARSSERGLMRAADVLKKYPSVRLEISGHSSSDGDPNFNQKLSEDRAESVRTWLVDTGGVDGSRLVARGAGSSEPVADNNTRAGREKNRRIEFKLLSGSGSKRDAAAAAEQLPD